MNPIRTPVNKLTADCLWNSFRSSGKRHIILTGSSGSGKTTLLSKLFSENIPGLTSWAEAGKAVYLKDNFTNDIVQIGIYDSTIPSKKNKMVLSEHGFTSLGIPALKRCMECNSKWISIDEIGYLEASCSMYIETLRVLFNQKQVVAVVRKQNLPFLEEISGRNDDFIVDLDDPYGKIGCVIMASGASKRFGGNKLMADFHGQPMICRILDATDGIFADRIVVTRHEEIARLCMEREIRYILHDLPGRNDTVRLGVEEMSSLNRIMFAPADQPLLRRDTVASLALASKNVPLDITRTVYDGVPGSPVVFPKWTYDELVTLPEGKGGSFIIKKYPDCVKTVSVYDKYELRDVDSPEDLADLLKINT